MGVIPLFDLTRQYRFLRDEIIHGIDKVIQNGRVILGPEVEKLEKNIAKYIGIKYGIGVSSGTDALVLAIKALNIGKGDFVITTPYTFFSTASSIHRNGAIPIFLDVDEGNYNLDLEQVEILMHYLKFGRMKNSSNAGKVETVEKVLKHYPNIDADKIKAIIPVHLFGRTMNLDQLIKLREKYGLKIIEDCAQSIGSEWKMPDGSVRKSGSIGDVSIFSFFPTKNLGAYGDGGMVITDSDELASRVRKLRVHGAEKKYFHDEIGLNARLDEIQAVILNIKMKYLDNWIRRRYEVAKMYTEGLKNISGIRKLPFLEWKENVRCHVYHQYVVEFESKKLREAVLNVFKEKSIGFAIYYPLPLHLQKCFSYLGYRKGDLPVSEKLSETTLALPIFPEISNEEIEHVVITLREVLERRRGI